MGVQIPLPAFVQQINLTYIYMVFWMEGIIEIKTYNWLYLVNPLAKENKEEIEREIKKSKHGNIGKYLFFSDDKNLLIKLAKEILIKYNLFNAKVPISDSSDTTSDSVLCIYDSALKLEDELKGYADGKRIKYGHWKSDSVTLDEQ